MMIAIIETLYKNTSEKKHECYFSHYLDDADKFLQWSSSISESFDSFHNSHHTQRSACVNRRL